MTKAEVIKWYKEITGGAGVDRYEALETLRRGRLAEKNWDDGLFTLGIEYGVLIALIKAFDITEKDLYDTSGAPPRTS